MNHQSDLIEYVPDPPSWLVEALSVSREEGVVEVDGCSLKYVRWGDPSKPGLLLTHGFLSHSGCFAFIAPYLIDDYHVVAFDMSGMGDSGTHAEYSEDIRVRELIGVAEQTGLFNNGAKPTIIAHSFGGVIATSAVHAYPEKFSGVIICDVMIIRPSILEANKDRFAPPGGHNRNRPNRIYPDYATAKARFVLAPPQPVNEPALFDYMAYHSLQQVDGGWTWKFDHNVFKRSDNTPEKWLEIGIRVASIPIPKAVIHGAESDLFTPDSSNYLLELIQENNLAPFPVVAIPNARHHLMLDQPMAFVSALKTQLANWSGA